MISDTSSVSSRSSSISSASSLTSAPISAKLDVLARCRYAKLCSQKQTRNVIATVPEICGEYESAEMDATERDVEAAQTLHELYSQSRSLDSPNRAGAKRSRTHSLDAPLHENVRELLMVPINSQEYPVKFLKSDGRGGVQTFATSSGRKRLCCSTEVAREPSQSNMHLAYGRPGMWNGILN